MVRSKTLILDERTAVPRVTAQYPVCPKPFALDPYLGCVHGCAYCFARQNSKFNRRRRFRDLDGIRPVHFQKWMARIYRKEIDFTQAETVFINHRVPLHLGATSDPCPPQEKRYHITEGILATLADYDYPAVLSTKNPAILFDVLRRFGPGLNLVVSVSLISTSSKWLSRIEPGAPSPLRRLEAISRIVNELGYPVMLRVQPAIYPEVLADLPPLIEMAHQAGVWAFATEGLKLRIAMTAAENRHLAPIRRGLRKSYRDRYGVVERINYLLRDEYVAEIQACAKQLARDHGLKYFSADNSPLGVGDGFECCGTEKLRNYKLWLYNTRSRAFGTLKRSPLGQCLDNFRWARWKSTETIEAVVDRHFATIDRQITDS